MKARTREVDRVRFGLRGLLRRAHLLALVLIVAACAPLGESAVAGEVTFVRDVQLPDGATVVVSLSDVSLADAPAKELGRAVLENPGRLPVRFRVPYDPSAIDPRSEYSLQARIMVGENLI
jgi:putative lipoprotein